MAEALAVVAALGFAGSLVTARLALRDSTVVTGILVGNVVAGLVLLIAVAIDPPRSIPLAPAGWFAFAGMIGGPGLGTAAILSGIKRLGPPTHGPLQGGAYGVAVSVGAALFLGEAVGPLKAMGVAAIVVGGGWLVRAGALSVDRQDGGVSPRAKLVSLPRGWYLPLFAGGALAAGDLIVKSNLASLPHPTFAAVTSMAGGTALWAIAIASFPRLRRTLRLGRQARWFVPTGVLLGAAFAALTTALNHGAASTVGPIVASEPLAVILLSALFLSELHRVTKGMVVAGALVVAGAILVSL
jgi:drug/metabolite transporter, DME family